MFPSKLTAFEKTVIAGLTACADLAAPVLEAWAHLPNVSVQSARSLVDAAQLGLTEEGAVRSLLEKSIDLGLVDAVPSGFKARSNAHVKFQRLAFALYAVEYYRSHLHQDKTVAKVVLTRPPQPSVLEEKLSAIGWRTSDLEHTERAFKAIVEAAQRRLVVMTPFLDSKGAFWLQELLSCTSPDVECVLILRSLESKARRDYPIGYDSIYAWLGNHRVRVFNYSIPKEEGCRETFHAKVVLCDRSAAYLGSSNITAASLEHSMEMGVVLQGRGAARVADVIDAVIEASIEWS